MCVCEGESSESVYWESVRDESASESVLLMSESDKMCESVRVWVGVRLSKVTVECVCVCVCVCVWESA